MTHMFVPVVDREQRPLMPTTPARARRWIKNAKAPTHQGKRRWNRDFSPLQVGKHWFYEELGKLAPVRCMQGFQTKELRVEWGLKKTSNKMAEVWQAHCVDAWVLAHAAIGGCKAPDNTRLVCIAPLIWHRRQLHKLQPAKGGTRIVPNKKVPVHSAQKEGTPVISPPGKGHPQAHSGEIHGDARP